MQIKNNYYKNKKKKELSRFFLFEIYLFFSATATGTKICRETGRTTTTAHAKPQLLCSIPTQYSLTFSSTLRLIVTPEDQSPIICLGSNRPLGTSSMESKPSQNR